MTGHIAPVNGLRFAMEHYLKHPEMITLLCNENLHRGRYVLKTRSLKRMPSPALEQIEAILRKGVEAGVFRSDIKPLQLYLATLALNYFYASNRRPLSAFLDRDLMVEEEIGPWPDRVWNMV
jgi:TetR/AcrR family transcriptional regulator, upper aerobic nicotinate degradation pathway regulator